jgi:hypothetical protein
VEVDVVVVAAVKVDVAAKGAGQVTSLPPIGELNWVQTPLDRNKEKYHNCGKIGHWVRDFRSKGKKEQAHVTKDDESSLLLVEQMLPSVPVTPALATIFVSVVTTPTASNTATMHHTTPPVPVRIVELVEESVYAVLDATEDRDPR